MPLLGQDLPPSQRISLPVEDPFSPVRGVAWSPDGRMILVGTRGVHVMVIDALTGNVLLSIEHHFEDISSVAWRPDGRQFASASLDGTIGIWDADTGNLLRSIE